MCICYSVAGPVWCEEYQGIITAPNHFSAYADKKGMTRLRSRLQHAFNPLHVYCRLRTLGVAHRAASKMTLCYERALYRLVLA